MTRELILYATPTGELARTCNDYFLAVERIGATIAQTYPPHCTLTGFFHVRDDRRDQVIEAISDVVASAGPVPAGAVDIRALGRQPEWIGLELESSWLIDLTSLVLAHHELEPGEDALRPKTWLHLSLAYGAPDLSAHAALAEELFVTPVAGDWEVAVWERTAARSWIRH